MTKSLPPRLLPEVDLPPYSYVSGLFPHPLRDPRGHAFGHAPPAPEPIDETNWTRSAAYLSAIDLFNHGYYWEAHEAWESLWHAANRRGPTADFLKGLIKLAAAGVKAREGRTRGVALHAARAGELFAAVLDAAAPEAGTYLGLSLGELSKHAAGLSEHPAEVVNTAHDTVVIVMPFVLAPRG